MDDPEPVKPTDPGDPPPSPQPPAYLSFRGQRQYQADLDQYQDDMTVYQDQVATYRQELDQWQTQYVDWKEKNEGAVGKAEGIINRFHKDYGATFDVSVTRHWLMLGFLSTVMLILTFVVQKRKDIV